MRKVVVFLEGNRNFVLLLDESSHEEGIPRYLKAGLMFGWWDPAGVGVLPLILIRVILIFARTVSKECYR